MVVRSLPSTVIRPRVGGLRSRIMTEDLITDLSKLSSIFVIARNSTFAYKGKPIKVQQVAEELGVRYILEGSVRRQGNQVRINAQLIDALGGHHLWADRYDGAMNEIFTLQDKVIGEIVSALTVKFTMAERSQSEQAETNSPQAYDALLQGWDHLRHDSENETLKAIPFFERAIELDPDYSRAHGRIDVFCRSRFWSGQSRSPLILAESARPFSQETTLIWPGKALETIAARAEGSATNATAGQE